MVRADALATFSGDLLVPNPAFLSAEEQQCLSCYQNGRVWLIGALGDMESRFPITRYVQEDNGFGDICLAVFGNEQTALTRIDNPAPYTFDAKMGMEPLGALWTHPLTYPPFADAFFEAVATCLAKATACPQIVRYAQDCEILSVRTAPNRYRVVVANDAYYYVLPQVDMGRPIKSVRCLTKYDGYKVPCKDTVFTCRVPGRGAEAFEVEVEAYS